MPPSRPSPNFMTGVPELLILRLLSDREMYGYEIAQAVTKATGEEIRLGEGVLYPALHALERSRCLASRKAEHNGRPRIYYTITKRGRERLGEAVSEWERVARALSLALGGPLRGRLQS